MGVIIMEETKDQTWGRRPGGIGCWSSSHCQKRKREREREK